MAGNPTWLAVVAGAIRDADGRILLQQALPGKRHAGQWEFPGGKVESGENPRLALAREVQEELGIALDPAAMRPSAFADEAGSAGFPAIVLFLYDCPVWTGEPAALEGQEFAWFAGDEADRLELAGMDRVLMRQLRG